MTGIIQFKPMPLDVIEVHYDDLCIGYIMPDVWGLPRAVWIFAPTFREWKHAATIEDAKQQLILAACDWLISRGEKADAALIAQQRVSA